MDVSVLIVLVPTSLMPAPETASTFVFELEPMYNLYVLQKQ